MLCRSINQFSLLAADLQEALVVFKEQIDHEFIESYLVEEEKVVGFFALMKRPDQRSASLWLTAFEKQSPGEFYQVVTNHLWAAGYERGFFMMNRKDETLHGYLKEQGDKAAYSLWEMEGHFQKPLVLRHPGLDLQPVTEETLQWQVEIGTDLFETPYEEELTYNQKLLEDPLVSSYLGFIEQVAVGMISCRKKGQKVSIADLAVKKDHQRKGYGHDLLCASINKERNKGHEHFVLSVKTENEEAITLYEKVGFAPKSVIDVFLIQKPSSLS